MSSRSPTMWRFGYLSDRIDFQSISSRATPPQVFEQVCEREALWARHTVAGSIALDVGEFEQYGDECCGHDGVEYILYFLVDVCFQYFLQFRIHLLRPHIRQKVEFEHYFAVLQKLADVAAHVEDCRTT